MSFHVGLSCRDSAYGLAVSYKCIGIGIGIGIGITIDKGNNASNHERVNCSSCLSTDFKAQGLDG